MIILFDHFVQLSIKEITNFEITPIRIISLLEGENIPKMSRLSKVFSVLLRVVTFLAKEVFDILRYSAWRFLIRRSAPSVQLSTGCAVGSLEVNNTVWAYRGIPYAKTLRFQAPVPLEPSNTCILNPQQKNGWNLQQMVPLLVPFPWLQSVVGVYVSHLCKRLRGDPNCRKGKPLIGAELPFQELNVFRPVQKEGTNEKLPVVVVIHGGGYVLGAADTIVQDGARLANALKSVVVCINYRLGLFGFAASSSGSSITTNCGYRDMLAALEWVKEHISHFNGDVNNITINGESAGGHAVLMLLANAAHISSKNTKRELYHRVFAQSAPAARILHMDNAIATTEKVASLLGWTADGSKTSVEEFLLCASAESIVQVSGRLYDNAMEQQQNALPFAPVLDKDVISFDIFGGLQTNAKRIRHIPLLSLYCKNEFMIFRDLVFRKKKNSVCFFKDDDDALKKSIAWFVDSQPHLQDKSSTWKDRVTALYNGNDVSNGSESADYLRSFGRSFAKATAFRGDAMLSFPAQLAAAIHGRQGAPSYLIRFDIHGGELLRLAAAHYVDVPYVFDNVASNRVLCGPVPVKGVTDILHKILIDFCNPKVSTLDGVPPVVSSGDSSNRRSVFVIEADKSQRGRAYVCPSPLPAFFDLWAEAYKIAYKI